MLNNIGTVSIETERLILRKFKEHDAIDMYNNWASDSEVTKFLTWKTHDSVENSIEIISTWIKEYDNKEFYQWAIEIKGSKDIIGSITLFNVDNNNENCELGYCIGKTFWNKGIVTEATLAVIDFGFKKIGFKRIAACHDMNNEASGSVLKKCGLKYEGTLRKVLKNNKGELVDHKFYSILIEDYLSEKEGEMEIGAKIESRDLKENQGNRNEELCEKEGDRRVDEKIGSRELKARKGNKEQGLREKEEKRNARVQEESGKLKAREGKRDGELREREGDWKVGIKEGNRRIKAKEENMGEELIKKEEDRKIGLKEANSEIREKKKNRLMELNQEVKKISDINKAKQFNVMVKNKLRDELGLFERYDEILEDIKNRITDYGAKTVVDMGCGTGNLCGELSKRLDVIGIDKNSEMISYTQKKYPNMKCKLGNFLDKPFRKNDVDIVVSTYALHGLTDNEKKKAIIYMLQYLKGNGKIVIADFMFSNDTEKEKCKNKLYSEKKEALWSMITEKNYTNIEKLKEYVKSFNCKIEVEHIANFTWIVEIKR